MPFTLCAPNLSLTILTAAIASSTPLSLLILEKTQAFISSFMMNGLLAVRDGEFWVESNKDGYELHAQVRTKNMTESAAERLLAASTSGENDSYKGISGKICRALDWLIAQQPAEEDEPLVFDARNRQVLMDSYAQKMSEALASSGGTVQWSFSQYIASENPDLKAEQWDELERSVLSNLADDIRIGVRDRDVFITVCWSDDEVWSINHISLKEASFSTGCT